MTNEKVRSPAAAGERRLWTYDLRQSLATEDTALCPEFTEECLSGERGIALCLGSVLTVISVAKIDDFDFRAVSIIQLRLDSLLCWNDDRLIARLSFQPPTSAVPLASEKASRVEKRPFAFPDGV